MDAPPVSSLLSAQARLGFLKTQLHRPVAPAAVKTYFSALQFNLDALEKGVLQEEAQRLPGIRREDRPAYKPWRKQAPRKKPLHPRDPPLPDLGTRA